MSLLCFKQTKNGDGGARNDNTETILIHCNGGDDRLLRYLLVCLVYGTDGQDSSYTNTNCTIMAMVVKKKIRTFW